MSDVLTGITSNCLAAIRHDVADASANERHDVWDAASNIRHDVAANGADVRHDIASADVHGAERVGDVRHDIGSRALGARKDAWDVDARDAFRFERLQRQAADYHTDQVASFKEAQGLAYQIEGRQAVEAAKNAAAAELTARTLAAETARQIAECCCEARLASAATNALILKQADETRALMHTQKEQDLRDKITRLELQNASLFARNAPPVTPVVL